MSPSINPAGKPAQVYEAISSGKLFKPTKRPANENEPAFLSMTGDSKIMVELQDTALRCQVIAPTVTDNKQYIAMILGKRVVAQYRILQQADTLDRVPMIVNFFAKEVEKVTHKKTTEPGFRIILASRENEPDWEYSKIYVELGKTLREKFGYREVTCHQYQDGSVLHAGFIGNPDAWPSCCEEIVGRSRTELKQINYLHGMHPKDYSLVTG